MGPWKEPEGKGPNEGQGTRVLHQGVLQSRHTGHLWIRWQAQGRLKFVSAVHFLASNLAYWGGADHPGHGAAQSLNESAVNQASVRHPRYVIKLKVEHAIRGLALTQAHLVLRSVQRVTVHRHHLGAAVQVR